VIVPAINKEMRRDYEKWERKREALKKVLDFVMYPTALPRVKYDTLKRYIQKLWDKEELSMPHYHFLNRVLEVEFAMMIANLEALEENDKWI